jgi:glyoxylase-like metal-dependent hydrolase (beta-lactamase superfamily II)
MLETAKLIHEILPVGMLQCNCHIVGDPKTREALVIDPGDDAERILAVIQRHNLRVTAIVITHTHIDHVGGLRRIHEATGAPVRMHADDLELYRGRFEAQVLHTPGHTQGSVCLYMPSVIPDVRSAAVAPKSAEREPGRLFAGDTLFAGSIGRTDLWGGSFETIIRSLKGKVLELPDETTVYPGHGPSTTIGEERQANPFLVGN